MLSGVGQKLLVAYPVSTLPFSLHNTTKILNWMTMCPAERLHLSATFAAGLAIEIQAEVVGLIFCEDALRGARLLT